MQADLTHLRVILAGPQAFCAGVVRAVSDTADIVAAFRSRFPAIVGPDTNDICYASQNRLMAVLDLAPHCEIALIVGAPNSLNATHVVEIARGAGVESHQIDGAEALQPGTFANHPVAGITASASMPQHTVNDVILRLAQWCQLIIEDLSGKVEHVHFRLPERLMTTPVSRRQVAMQHG